MLYVFWEPLQANAPASEWFLGTLSFVVFLILATIGAIYWSRARIMLCACIAMAALAVVFTIYQPYGVLYFLYVAAYAPLAVSGRLIKSLTLVAATATLVLIQWWLLWPLATMPFVIALEALIIGVAVTLVVREQDDLRNILIAAEQERIARDLHDVLGHTLSVIVLKSEVAIRLGDADWKRARHEIQDVEDIARQALSEVRNAITGFSSRNLLSEVSSARAALQAAEVTVEERFDNISLPQEIERTLSLVLREAVTNVVRHAQATRCRLSLEQSDGALRMEVCDNGRGNANHEGFGMRSIRKRLSEIDGTAEWLHRNGTQFTVTVPFRSESRG